MAHSAITCTRPMLKCALIARNSRPENFNLLEKKELAPRARFELATLRLTAECSTIELPGSSATALFSFYYGNARHATTIR